MEGLVGFISGFGAALIALLFLTMVWLHSLFAQNANPKLLYAALTAFGVMLGFVALFIADEEEGKFFPVAYYDWLGPAWIIVALVLALLVFGVGDKSNEDTFGKHLDKWNKWGG